VSVHKVAKATLKVAKLSVKIRVIRGR